MVAGWKSDDDRAKGRLKSEIRTLVSELEHADSAKIRQLWRLGCKLSQIEAALDEKTALAGGSNYYYRSLRIFKHFRTLALAKAYRGSLRQALKEAQEGIQGRGAVAIRYPQAAKQLRRLAEDLWRRTPFCDRERLLDSMERLAGEFRRRLGCRREPNRKRALQPTAIEPDFAAAQGS